MIRRRAWIAVLLALLGFNRIATAQPAPPRIEVAFAMDATGSMGPYIDQARARIAQIAESLAQGSPKPDVRFGLVAFRDKGDDYVTRVHDFTGELKQMQAYLADTSANGGGDAPEAVLEALSAALTKLSWSKPTRDDPVVRLLYLVGDAPAQHYDDSPKESWIAAQARDRGIVIHSIACGSSSDLESTFEGMARHTEGRFFRLTDSARSVARAGLGGPPRSLASTLTDTTRAYSGSVGVDYDGKIEPLEIRKLEMAAAPVASSGAPAPTFVSGLFGAQVRWVSDERSWRALWQAHMSLTPDAERRPVPAVDFTKNDLLVVGGSDVGLEIQAVERRGDHRQVRVRPATAKGVQFALIAKAGAK